MSDKNKETLKKGNAAIAEGDNEGFLALCTEDTKWLFVGEQVLEGKEAVRKWMAATYIEPPKLTVENLISEGDFLTAQGTVAMKDKDGKLIYYAYCDVWRFSAGKIIELKAFVIKTES